MSADPKQVVFIDSRAPDIQALIAGVQPGVRAFVLDAASDGVQQIADILAANHLTGLSAISIVGHGASGEIQLGSTWLDDSDLADHAAALSTIGAALTADGDLALYACNTAAGAAGQQFIADLSAYTGADVAAATHVVGDAAHGGSWTLDASTGSIAASAPFTAATLANFQGALAALSGQLWYGVNGVVVGSGSEFGYVNTDGSSQTDAGVSPGVPVFYSYFGDVALDTAAGLYFAVNRDVNNDYTSLVVGRTGTGAAIGSPILLNPNGNTSDYVVHALAVDPQNDYIYIGIWGTVGDSGIIRVSYNQITGVVNGGNAIISGGVIDPSLYVIKAGTNFTNPDDFALDVAHQKLYFTASDITNTGGFYGNGFTNTNGVYVVDLATATPTTAPTLLSAAFPGDGNHSIVALAINTAHNIIYFATADFSGNETFSSIYSMSTSGGAVTLMTLPSGITPAFIASGGLAYDPVSNQLIVSDGGNNNAPSSAIYTLQLNAGGTTFTSGTTLAHADATVTSAFTTGIAFDALATIGTLNGTSTQALQLGSGITLLAATPTGVSDSDGGGNLASATVSISNAQAGDIIGLDTNFSLSSSATNISIGGVTFLVSYDSVNHVLTLANPSGVLHTYAEYEAALAHVTFKDTGIDSSVGAHPTRTITWQVNDGAVGNPTGTTNVTTTTVTIDRAIVTVADTGKVVEGATLTSSQSVLFNDSDKDGDTITLTAIKVSGGATGSIGTPLAGLYGHLTLSSNGNYTYVADNTSAIDAAPTGSHPLDDFLYSVSDGTATTTTQLEIIIDRAPTVTADTDAVVAAASTTAGHSVLTNDTDHDGDTVTVSAIAGGTVGGVTTGTYGDLTLNADGTYSYAANHATAIANAPANSHPTDVFTYTASDGQGGTTTSTLTITIDRAPVAAPDTNTASLGGGVANGNVIAGAGSDTDKDGDTLTVATINGGAGTVNGTTHGTYGDLTLNGNGSYAYLVGATVGQQTALAGAGPNPIEHFTYTISDGNGGTAASTLDINVLTNPVISLVTTSGTDIDGGGNGDLNAGHTVTFTLTMSEAVTVAGGVPTLTLSDGGTATYSGGSGTAALTFTYTVSAGENSSNLEATAVVLHGATVQNVAATNTADFTTVPETAGTLQIDTTTPTVSSVTTSGTGISAGNGDLNAGHVVTFTVHTSEALLVDTTGGTPTLTLSNGATATYSGGNGSNALTFSYTVAAGQDTSDLAVSAVHLNGGTVKDGATNDADLSAAVSNPAGTLQIDTHAPAVSSVTTSGTGIDGSGNGDLNAGHVVTFTVNLDEAVTVAGVGTPTLTLNNGGVATYSGGSGSTALTFTYTVGAGQDTSDLAVTTANLNGATIKDAATNNADLTAAAINPTGTLHIDTTAPTVSSVTTSGTGIDGSGNGDLNAGHTVTFTVNLNESVTVDTTGGTPILVLNDGGTATYSGGSGSSALTFTYTVAAGENIADLAVTGSSPNGGTVLDGAGNAANFAGATTNPAGTLQIDTTAPTVSSVTTSGTGIDGSGNGDLNAGHVVTFTVHLNESVTVDTTGGTPTLALNDGGTATYSGGSGSSGLTFTYTVAAGENIADLAVTGSNLHGATVLDGAGNVANLTGAATNPTGTLQIDTTAAHVASVTTSGAGIDGGGNGILTVGSTVTFTVNLDETVFVSGGPATLALDNGGIATYSGGSGSSALTFTYTVASGENTSDLHVTAVSLNGATVATVQDAATNDADLSGAVANPAGTLQISTTAPTVSSVTTSGTGITAGSGDLNVGHTVTFTVTLDENVFVAGGTPTLTLNNGGVATYSSGSGGAALTFTYTVAAGQDIGDLAVTAANLNGATIKDAATNSANLAAAITNPVGTLQIDTTAPTVSSVTTSGIGITAGTGDINAGHTVTFTVNLSEVVTIAGGTPTLTLNDGGVATYSGGSGSNALTFTYTVAAGENTSDLAVTGSSLNGATAKDGAGNAANLAGAATNPVGTLQIDTTAPTVSSVATSGTGITAGNGVLHTGDAVTFTVNLSEVVTVAGGTPTLTLNDGGVATYSGGTGTNALTFTYTVAAGQNTADLAVTGLALNGATAKDGAGNSADLSAATANPVGTLQIDTIAPTVSSVATSGAFIAAGNGLLHAGDVVTFTVSLSEAVTVAGGVPSLTLNDGGSATYSGGTGTNTLTFTYTVATGQNTADLAVTGVVLNGASAKDAAGNDADLSAAITNPAGTLKVDTAAPTVSSVTTSGTDITAGSGDLSAGHTVHLAVNLSEVVVVAGGTPTLTLNDGGTATYVSGSGSSTLIFDYVVAAGQNTADLAVTGAALNGAIVLDLATNIADLSAAITNPTGTLQIDTHAPSLNSGGITASPSSGLVSIGQTVHITMSFDEAVSVINGIPTLSLNDGGTATYNATASAVDPTKLVFDYTVALTDSITPALSITGINLHGGLIVDHAGNGANPFAVNVTFGVGVDTGLITANPDSNHVAAGNPITADAAHGVLANDTDTNPADHLVVSAVNGSAAGVDHSIAGAYGSLTLHADGSYSYTANGSSEGYVVDSFTYTAANGHSPTATSTLSISVVGGNYAYVQVPHGGSGATTSTNFVLDGSAGNATLNSSSSLNSQHILIGGPGDTLNGAYGRDTFVFAGDFGHNTVNNFQTSLDKLQLQQSQVGSLANVLADFHQVGADAVLTLDASHVVTITNMQVASLTAANFHLV